MFGRCCFTRPRPMCGGAAPVMPRPHCGGAGLPSQVIPLGGGCQTIHEPCEVVVEPALMAAPNIFNHHKHVQHIQPVITQDIHNIHTHHNYVVQEERKAAEFVKHAHGLCGPAVTRPAQPCPPCGGGPVPPPPVC